MISMLYMRTHSHTYTLIWGRNQCPLGGLRRVGSGHGFVWCMCRHTDLYRFVLFDIYLYAFMQTHTHLLELLCYYVIHTCLETFTVAFNWSCFILWGGAGWVGGAVGLVYGFPSNPRSYL